jgi:hypothetical protein
MIRQMTVTMLTKYFLDLVAAFAVVDKRAAHDAINAVAQDVSRGLFQLRSELVKRGWRRSHTRPGSIELARNRTSCARND